MPITDTYSQPDGPAYMDLEINVDTDMVEMAKRFNHTKYPKVGTTVTSAPTIDSITPDNGAQGNTVAVVITGDELVSGATVSFDGATGVRTHGRPTCVDGTIHANVVLDTNAVLGTFDVLVTNPDEGAVTEDNGFEVTENAAVTVTSVNPNNAFQGDSFTVSIGGTGFDSDAAVSVEVPGVTVTNTVVVSATAITATFTTASDAALGDRDVTVLNGDSGTATLADGFTVNDDIAVTLTDVDPDNGDQGDTVAVTLTGTGFDDDAAVSVEGTGVTVNSVDVVDGTSITANFVVASNATLGDRDVTVLNGDGGTATATDAFTVNDNVAVTVLTIVPWTGAQGEVLDDPVVITGTGFEAGLDVSVSGTKVVVTDVSYISATEVHATFTIAADAATGFRNVVVTNTDGGTGTGTGMFEVTV